jgi:hypothetical protein
MRDRCHLPMSFGAIRPRPVTSSRAWISLRMNAEVLLQLLAVLAHQVENVTPVMMAHRDGRQAELP